MKFEVTLANGEVVKFASANHVYTHAVTVRVEAAKTGEVFKAYMLQRCHNLANAQKRVASVQKEFRYDPINTTLRYIAEITEVRQVK